MKDLAIAVSRKRAQLREAALRAGEGDELDANKHKVQKLVDKCHRGYFSAMQPKEKLAAALRNEVPGLCRKRGCKRGVL